jgi:hypothetical protein
MYELAAEAKAFKARDPLAGADPAEWDLFWTPCFLRLARCHLHVPKGLVGSARILSLEEEAVAQLVGACRSSYGDGALRGAGGMSRALGRLLEDGGFDLGLLARLALAEQPKSNLAPGLLSGVIVRLLQPDVRARVQAQLAAAQAGMPPARRLTYEQLGQLFARTALIQDPHSPTPASMAAQRCGGPARVGGCLQGASTAVTQHCVRLASCVLWGVAHRLM